MWIAWSAMVVIVLFVAASLAWRWASRRRSLPCPTLFAWMLENPIGTQRTLDRMPLRPGQRVLEIGPGPGRLLVPAAQRVLPGGEVVGIDIQPGMIKRLVARAKRANVDNLTAILGDASQPHFAGGRFDLVFLCTVLGEVPDRAAVLAEAFRTLKPGGTLCVTELVGDPHYQSRSTVKRLAAEAGFRFESMRGGWWFYTASFVKP
jgi:ubiquinone/menaquinone biosynthesis C-methylase UbiE